MSITLGADCTHANIASLPAGLFPAGYVTEANPGDGIAWTAADFAKYPHAVRIAQSPALSVDVNAHADVLDVEAGAATLADIGAWATAALASFKAASRPGQRTPLVYCSASNVTAVVNALNSAKLNHGEVGLWVAHWGEGQATAIADVNNASGPWPVHATQYANAGKYDLDVFSTAWLSNVSGKPAPPTSFGGVQAGWRWCTKCQGLFWGNGVAKSVCPAGNRHVFVTTNYSYVLTWEKS